MTKFHLVLTFAVFLVVGAALAVVLIEEHSPEIRAEKIGAPRP